MQLAWTTDIHLNFVELTAWENWIESIRSSGAHGLIITGDISESDDLLFQLIRMEQSLDMPIYFVLGNHDFYGSSIRSVREMLATKLQGDCRLIYLSTHGVIRLNDRCALIGQDGWGDAYYGDCATSPVELSDFQLIEELSKLRKPDRERLLRDLGRREADQLMPSLQGALEVCERVVVATHVPPFLEACRYEGNIANDQWSPFFSCGAIGELLVRTAETYLDREILVLCGHTHHAADEWIRPNLQVIAGSAQYGSPELARMIPA